MSSVGIYKSGDQALDLFQTRLKAELDPVLGNRFVQGLQLPSFTLNPGVNVINHLLSRQQQGWSIVDISGPAVIWRNQPLTSTTLTLTCSAVAAITISLWVF